MRYQPPNNAAQLSPIEQEVILLREENRRLKGLIELKEDRSEFDRQQVRSRNFLLAWFLVTFVVLGGSWFYTYEMRAQLNQQITQRDATIRKLKNGALVIME